MTTNEPSGSHTLPPQNVPSDTRGVVIEVKHIIAVAAFLGLGGVGAGVVTVGGQHQQAPVPPEVVTALAEIKAQLVVMSNKLDTSGDRLADHEKRLRELEARARAR